MKYTYKIIFCLVLCFSTLLQAQQDSNYTMYMYNMNVINPAYAGANETIDFSINIRSQWANVEGAPETQSFVFGMPLGNNMGIGLSVINDKTFVETQTAAALDFSYHLKLNETHDLYFGVKGGLNSYNANTNGLVTYDIQPDPKLMNLNGKMYPNIGAGIYVKHNDYFLSFSVPKFLSPDRLEEENGIATVGADKIHMYFSGGYNFVLNETITLKPSTLVRYVKGSPLSIDVTTVLEFNAFFNFGAAYRINESISGLVFFNATKTIKFGYAYESPFENSIRNIDNGTHELVLRLRL